jgi:hypothetical protein
VLGGSIFALTQDKALAGLQQSDFAILTVASSANERQSFVPFNLSMQSISPALIDWAERHLVPLGHYHFFDRDVALYVRPTLTVQGASGVWITSDGVTLVGLSDVLRARPLIELHGQASFQFLPKVPEVSATVLQTDGNFKSIPAALTRSGDTYSITMTLKPTDVPVGSPVKIRLSFDTYYVPKALGLGADTRKLVVRTPDTIVLQER